jgi:hypothetical protein
MSGSVGGNVWLGALTVPQPLRRETQRLSRLSETPNLRCSIFIS